MDEFFEQDTKPTTPVKIPVASKPIQVSKPETPKEAPKKPETPKSAEPKKSVLATSPPKVAIVAKPPPVDSSDEEKPNTMVTGFDDSSEEEKPKKTAVPKKKATKKSAAPKKATSAPAPVQSPVVDPLDFRPDEPSDNSFWGKGDYDEL